MKPPHYQGTYQRRARALVTAANHNPNTKCWRCHRTLDQHPNHKTGRPPHWTAGHTRDTDPTAPLAPEASTCNYTAGAHTGNARRSTGYNYP